MLFRVSFLMLLCCSMTTIWAQESFEKGKIIDRIFVGNSSTESFALYLPHSYQPDSLSTIVFIFDPAGNGKNGIRNFVQTAETFNYILVSSNTTKNGPYDRNFDVADRLFEHVFSHFKIKEKNIYLAGFSGGSRLASTIAVLTNQMAGVVACGAGFANAPQFIPSTQNFDYVGVCGNGDMNYQEMINVKRFFQKRNFNHTLFTFDGNHSWPPPEQLFQAFSWLEVQAYKKGLSDLNESAIYDQYSSSYLLAIKAEKQQHYLKAAEHYERILDTYSSLYAVDSVLQRYKKLFNSSGYKKASKNISKAFKIETDFTQRFVKQFNMDYDTPKKANFSWWEKELAKLDKYRKNPNKETEKMLERITFNLFAIAYSRANPQLFASTEAQLAFSTKICQLIYPDFKRP